MNPSRREALAALAAGRVAPARAADPPKLTLSSFAVEITVPIGHPLMGGGIAPAKEIVDPLYAHGFVLRGLDKPVAVVALDWCEVRNGAYDLLRAKLAAAVGTDPARVMLSSLHQHDAPVADLDAEELLVKHKAGASVCDRAFVERTAARVADAAGEALAKTRPVTHIGTGKAVVEKVASNRRYTDAAGLVRHNRLSANRDPAVRAAEEGLVDPELTTLSFWDGETPLLGLAAYAVHPMSHYGKGLVSADFVGLARKRRQADTPGVAQMYVSGCSGNVTAGKYNDGDPGNRPVLADRLHRAMAAAWKATTTAPVTAAAFRSVPLRLKARTSPGFTEDELMKRLTGDRRPFGRCLAALGLSWKRRADAGRPIDLPVLDFGTAVYALLPAESYVEYQLLARKRRPGAAVVVAGYGECGPGYIPTERAWAEGDVNLADWCWVDPGSEGRMADAIGRVLSG